ncbi:MAG: exodeoxyribonuclease VII large subunit [Pseudomonadota bacterium]
MNDFFESSPRESAAPGGNLPALSVSEISQAVKRTLEGAFERVRVRGEISGFKRAASGHLYMTLKDDKAVLDGVCWKGVAGRLSIRPEDGMEVIASGRVTSYPGRSKYQLVIDSMELAGEGALLKLLEERRKKLAAEGLFAQEAKQSLPFLPEVIGVVTSPTGAVIRDILHRLADRFPRHVLVWPVLVQGDGAAEQVASAIQGFNELAPGGPVPKPDLLIVARGGGSLEDLWAFNEEVVVRAAAASEIPLISAVGHETDTTLIDYASDGRAPTPTAAAEIAVPIRRELVSHLVDLERRLLSGAGRALDDRRTLLEGFARGLPDPRRLVEEMAQRLDERSERLELAIQSRLQNNRSEIANLAASLPHPRQQLNLCRERLTGLSGPLRGLGKRVVERGQNTFDRLDAGRRLSVTLELKVHEATRSLETLSRVLESVSHKKVLSRGFALVRAGEDVITAAGQVSQGQAMTIEFSDGLVGAVANDSKMSPKPKNKDRPSPEKKSGSGQQGTLL